MSSVNMSGQRVDVVIVSWQMMIGYRVESVHYMSIHHQ